MQELKFMREIDKVTATPGTIELTDLTGRWRSSEQRTGGISGIDLTVQNDAVAAHVYGGSQDNLIDWGAAPVSALFTDGVSSLTCAGVQLRYDFKFLTSYIQANLKLGVLVLGVFHSFRGKRGGNNYFFREFMAVTQNEVEPGLDALGKMSCLHDRLLGGSTAAVSVLQGSWKNTNPNSRGILALELEVSGTCAQVEVRALGIDSVIDWGESTGEIFTCIEEDRVPSAAILVRYNFGFCDCELQIRQNKGILAVTTFTRFQDQSGRSDYVIRELFYRGAH